MKAPKELLKKALKAKKVLHFEIHIPVADGSMGKGMEEDDDEDEDEKEPEKKAPKKKAKNRGKK